MITKYQRRTIGAVFKINLGEGYHSYGQAVNPADDAFFDIRTKKDMGIDDIVKSKVLFIICVHKYAISKFRWKIIGKAEVRDELKTPPLMYTQNPLDKNDIQIYKNGKFFPATKAEVKGLESLSVWDANHVEDRLRDHFAGKKNKWVESMKLVE